MVKNWVVPMPTKAATLLLNRPKIAVQVDAQTGSFHGLNFLRLVLSEALRTRTCADPLNSNIVKIIKNKTSEKIKKSLK